MAHGDARDGKWRGNWRMEWVASTLRTTSEHAVFSITTADAHTSAASSPLNWRPCRFKWTRPFRRKPKSGFWACAITFQMQSNAPDLRIWRDTHPVWSPRTMSKSPTISDYLKLIWPETSQSISVCTAVDHKSIRSVLVLLLASERPPPSSRRTCVITYRTELSFK